MAEGRGGSSNRLDFAGCQTPPAPADQEPIYPAARSGTFLSVEPENVATFEGSLMPGRVGAKSTSGELTRPKPALPDNPRSRATARIALAIGLIVLALWVAQDFLAPLGWAVGHRLGRLAGLSKVRRTHRRWTLEYLGAAFFYDPRRTAVVCTGRARNPPGCAGKSDPVAIGRAYRENGIAVPEWLPQMPWGARRALVDCQSERSEERQ